MRISWILILMMLLMTLPVFGEDRIPRPEFKGDYQIPSPTSPQYQDRVLGIWDTVILLAALVLASLLALKWRSRIGLLALGIFSLIYFGFIRRGCICPIGSIQNMALSLADPGYTIPIIALIFFLLPLIFSLFTGRSFCSSVCPLGMVQDLVARKPSKLPVMLKEILEMIPVIYLGVSLLYVFTGSGFLICRFDPFVGFFRLSGNFEILLFGGALLVIGIWIARPYCRFLCPYGLILGWLSRFSWKHLSITPDKCVQCHLCADVCPYDAIKKPHSIEQRQISKYDKLRMNLAIFLFIPIVLSGIAIAYLTSPLLAQGNYIVHLAALIEDEEKRQVTGETLDTQSFRNTGVTLESLYEDARMIKNQFSFGSLFLGGFIGLIIAYRFYKLSQYREQTDYEPDRGKCFSCGRCIKVCPREYLRVSTKRGGS